MLPLPPFRPPKEETMPIRRLVLTATALAAFTALPAQAQTEIQWWHSMTAVNNE